MFTVDISNPWTIYWMGVLITFLVMLSLFGVLFGVKDPSSDEVEASIVCLGLGPLFWPLVITVLIFFGIPFVCVSEEFQDDIKALFKKKNKN